MTTENKPTSTNGSESCNTMTVELLLQEVNLTNNGYLFACTPQMLAFAGEHPAIFTVSDGLIFKAGTRPAQYPGATKTRQVADETDYEALIFNRQAALAHSI